MSESDVCSSVLGQKIVRTRSDETVIRSKITNMINVSLGKLATLNSLSPQQYNKVNSVDFISTLQTFHIN